ncbi:Dihydrolipoyl dehydrogenase [Nocardioides dokdonensis FR1436]|uniref:Dihydrolipoyl dehydrogenase n=1 Tax=Nocardioides dokdonensis FR1436 TaxID=1300347 RepID=A0A1A9GH55_9ACTN|nr:FAD-dependent oxidoreductase [Nocardioides dokdonensis]ANH37627.1 Dihydrolipoyl dehydrogenase [Nocardioides dokdonensis FR1436]
MSAAPERVRTEVLVLGGGPGGYVAALRAATLGAEVTLVERDHLGGVCLNEGCIPSKILLHAAETVESVVHAPWARSNSPITLDHAGLQLFKTDTVGRLRGGIAGLLRARRVRVITGLGRFTGEHTLAVEGADGGTEVEFDYAVVATGSAPVELASLPFDHDRVVHARHVLDWRHTPDRVVVVGGGAIGVELATFLGASGAEVLLVEAQDRLLAGFDATVVRPVLDALRERGVSIRTSTVVEDDDGTTVGLRSAAGEVERIETDHVVVAVGRRPLLPDLGPLDLRRGPGGHLLVDDRLRTSAPHVFAIGDLTQGPALAHRAMAQGKVAGHNAHGADEVFDPVCVPSVVYSAPELARAGLTPDEAQALGHDVATTRFSLRGNGRALGLGVDGDGLLLHDAVTGLVLGFELSGPAAGEVVPSLVVALEMGAVVQDLADMVFPHPSVSEVVGEMADLALGLGLHGR